MSAVPININEPRGPFKSFGEQLQSIRQAETGLSIDSRLHEVHRRAAAAGGSEAVPADGGFLVQPEFAQDILKRMYLTGDIISRCTTFNIIQPNRSSFRIPQFNELSRANGSRLGGVTAYYENEADTLIASKPAFRVSEFVPRKITGLVYLTDELLLDSDALESWMIWALSQELTFKTEYGVVQGTGAGQPLGIVNAPATVTVAAEVGQASGTVVAANIQKMLESFWAASYNSVGACWLYNQGLLQGLASLQTVVGTGGSESKLWQWASSVQEFDLLAGFPALISEYCSAPGTPGDIILCDLSRYVLAFRGPVRNELSIHLKFLTDEVAFRAIVRVNGSPVDNSPVTPLFGSTSTSSFVTLAAR